MLFNLIQKTHIQIYQARADPPSPSLPKIGNPGKLHLPKSRAGSLPSGCFPRAHAAGDPRLPAAPAFQENRLLPRPRAGYPEGPCPAIASQFVERAVSSSQVHRSMPSGCVFRSLDNQLPPPAAYHTKAKTQNASSDFLFDLFSGLQHCFLKTYPRIIKHLSSLENQNSEWRLDFCVKSLIALSRSVQKTSLASPQPGSPDRRFCRRSTGGNGWRRCWTRLHPGSMAGRLTF